MTGQLNYKQWRARNPDVENWADCPDCHGDGWNDDDDNVCRLCRGMGEINNLRTLFENQRKRERDLLIWWLLGVPMFTRLEEPVCLVRRQSCLAKQDGLVYPGTRS